MTITTVYGFTGGRNASVSFNSDFEGASLFLTKEDAQAEAISQYYNMGDPDSAKEFFDLNSGELKPEKVEEYEQIHEDNDWTKVDKSDQPFENVNLFEAQVPENTTLFTKPIALNVLKWKENHYRTAAVFATEKKLPLYITEDLSTGLFRITYLAAISDVYIHTAYDQTLEQLLKIMQSTTTEEMLSLLPTKEGI